MILRRDRHSVVHALRVLQSPCYDIEGCDWFVLEIDEDLAFRLLDRVALFATAQAKDGGTLEIVFSDISGRFVADIDPLSEVLGGEQPECCHLVVRAGEVLWRA